MDYCHEDAVAAAVTLAEFHVERSRPRGGLVILEQDGRRVAAVVAVGAGPVAELLAAAGGLGYLTSECECRGSGVCQACLRARHPFTDPCEACKGTGRCSPCSPEAVHSTV